MGLNAEVELNYELPYIVETIKDGWLCSLQSAATVSGLLATVAAQLIVFFKDADTFKYSEDDPRKDSVLALTYMALILSIGTTVSSLMLTADFTNVTAHAARKRTSRTLESSKTAEERHSAVPIGDY